MTEKPEVIEDQLHEEKRLKCEFEEMRSAHGLRGKNLLFCLVI